MSAATVNFDMPSPLTRVVASFQRILMATLLCAHFALPHLLVYAAGNQLLLDSILPSQLCILLIALAFADLSWIGAGLLLTASMLTGYGWMVVYPTHLHRYALETFGVPLTALGVALVVLRLRGYRGSWNPPAIDAPAPWQVSIRFLMIVTAVVAVTFAAATWMRDVPVIGVAGNDLWATVLTFAADGLSTTLLCLAAIWAAGTQGAGFAKFLVLISIAVFLVVFQIYAFRLETFWHLPAFMSACWILVACGSLYVWRVCGWRVVSPSRLTVQS